jgi:hypothetical protein
MICDKVENYVIKPHWEWPYIPCLHAGMLFLGYVGMNTPVYGDMQTDSNGHLLLLDSYAIQRM